VPLSQAVIPPPIRRSLFVLFAAVALVLALACANVVNLSLVQVTVRGREMAVRAALGAGRSRLARQLVTEGVLLASAGGMAGLGLAAWGLSIVMSAVAVRLPRAPDVGLDWRVFAFLLAVCLLSGILSGLVPSIAAAGAAVRSASRGAGGSEAMSRRQGRLRDGLVVFEVAMAFTLALGAALLVRELVRLQRTDPGMVTSNVVTVHLGERMTPQTDAGQFDEIADRISELPGVRAAGFTQLLPLQNWGWTSNSTDFRVRGLETSGRPPFEIGLRFVTRGYFDALGIPIRRGRGFTAGDTSEAPPVILINDTLARMYFGDRDPIGVLTTRGTIVGVVGDVRQVNLDRPSDPEIYYPVAQNWSQLSELGMSLVVRTDRSVEAVVDAVRGAVAEVNPNLAIFTVRTMEGVIDDSLAEFRLYLSLLASFAALALVLALTGTYGVMAYVARSRMHEFAVRVALGADRSRVARLVVGRGVWLTGLGLAAGGLAVAAAAPLLQNAPVAIRPPDFDVVAPIAALVFLAGVSASLVPALRAAAVDPMTVLRNE
jgi:predicted permease